MDSNNPELPQQYCLRWNNHQHNLLSVFEDLLNHEAFVDVTLACDGVQLKAHKMVLSACSPYFQSLLYNTPDRHPIVFLRDVRYHEMKALLEFMYRGEVSVDQDNLTSLLKVAEGLKIKGLAEVSGEGNNSSNSSSSNNHNQPFVTPSVAVAPLPMLHPPSFVRFPGLISAPNPSNASIDSSPNCSSAGNVKSHISPPTALAAAAYLGPKRKRGRPRRLSGSEAVPLASGLTDNASSLQETIIRAKVAKAQRGSIDGPANKPLDSMSEADSIDGRSSGVLRLKKESVLKEPPYRDGGAFDAFNIVQGGGKPVSYIAHSETSLSLATSSRPQPLSSHSPQPPPAHSHPFPTPPHRRHEDGNQGIPPSRRDGSGENILPDQHTPLPLDGSTSSRLPAGHPMRGTRSRGRRGRGKNKDRSHQRSLSEMSVRGLDLLRYATLSPDGTYRCTECYRVQINKNFKNKYSFQRHAFLYHEGSARKVFPCTVCKKEFSRPDKMKQHLKQSHEGSPSKAKNTPVKPPAKTHPATSRSALKTSTCAKPSDTSSNAANVAAAANAAATLAAMTAGAISSPALLVNPFLDLNSSNQHETPDPKFKGLTDS